MSSIKRFISQIFMSCPYTMAGKKCVNAVTGKKKKEKFRHARLKSIRLASNLAGILLLLVFSVLSSGVLSSWVLPLLLFFSILLIQVS